jgi:hypothetical protein
MSNPEIVGWFDDNWLDTFSRGVKSGFASLSHRDRALALVGSAFDHEIGAGRRVLYEGPVGAHTAELADAFEVIGSKKAAKVIRDFAATFPGGAPSPDDEERERQVSELPSEAWKVLRKFGDLFEECAGDGERVLLHKLYDWYHAQSGQAEGSGSPAAPKPAKKSPRKGRQSKGKKGARE